MNDYFLAAAAVLVLITCWPASDAPVDGISLAGAVFVALPLGGALAQSPLAFWGWALLAFAAFVLARWLRDKWQAQ